MVRLVSMASKAAGMKRYIKDREEIFENKELIGYYEKHEYRNVEIAKPYDFSKSLV